MFWLCHADSSIAVLCIIWFVHGCCVLFGAQPMFSTIEDIYVALVDTDRGQKEKVHFYDTAGLVCCCFLFLTRNAMQS